MTGSRRVAEFLRGRVGRQAPKVPADLPQWLDMREAHPMRRGGPPRRDASQGEVTKRGFCNPKTPLKIGERWFGACIWLGRLRKPAGSLWGRARLAVRTAAAGCRC